jgi:hypothetical protein
MIIQQLRAQIECELNLQDVTNVRELNIVQEYQA